ncbi:MAG: hypothetical protein AAF417_18015 [Pseudomonadota bacterium]
MKSGTTKRQITLTPLVLTGLSLCAAWTNGVAQIESNADLSFITRGQSLFFDAGEVTRTESLRFDVLNEQTETQRGRIENSQVPLSVATLQAIWTRAINTCTSQSYTVPVVGTRISPSQTECINGEIRRNYCVAPPQLGWSVCPNVGNNRRTFVRDLGPGIGPRPTQPAKRPYDFGAIVSMTTDVKVGFEGSYSYDLGSVDIDYSAQASLNFDKDSAEPGEEVTITTSLSDREPYLMTSRYPSFELALDMYSYATMSIDADYAGVDEANGDQVRATRNLHTIDSRENPDAIDGFVPFTDGEERLFGVLLDSTGYTTTVLGEEELIEARYEYNLTYPFGSPDEPGKKAPPFRSPLSFSLADFAFTVPQLDTAAPFGFRCGDCVPYRNDIVDGKLTNSTPVGRRQLIGGITDGNGIVLPFVNDGEQDVDLLRVDVDLDVVTVAAGVPLGAIVSDPLNVFSAEVNLLDLDLANFISADQTLSFRPNLEVQLAFSVPTMVRTASESDFVETTTRTIDVGDTLIFLQPETQVTITPIYSVRNNEFTNLTQLKVSSAIQETIGQVKIGGYVGEHLAEVLGDDPNFALLQITPTLYEPATIWSSGDTPWSLSGFLDQPAIPVTVALASANNGGGGSNGGGNSGGGNNAGGGGSGGGGALYASGLLVLLLSAAAARRRNRLRIERRA